ncbi:Protein CBG27187 [Caenorhabditis briggsae]|uniref:Protein CBG27187 n=1 Tax=Caenorhabditis briggsae TaxID=6238 RepID=B6IL17_CAEBR|nr:Protein CBG27187 [Caenorhabditis briggsae]CAS00650.1 Protein CBG27187 [Caenorhabditis briggsae]
MVFQIILIFYISSFLLSSLMIPYYLFLYHQTNQ